MGNEEKEYKGYFHPWKGTHYEDGINGTTILIIGVQHWCDPSYWYCEEKTPHECLKKRDRTCTVWNRHKYEENEKCYEWVNEKNKTMPRCPLALDEKSKYNCKDKGRNLCLFGGFRFLHCETKISIYEHIRNQGKRKRAQIFVCLSDALTTLFPNELKEEEKKEYYFDRIVFANYIQHYTKFYQYGSLDDNELGLNPANDKKGFERNFRLFGEKGPDVIIVLQNEKILKEVESILNERYKKKHYMHLQEKDRPEYYYVWAQSSSKFYKQYRDGIKDFIKIYINDILDKEHEKKEITRLIEALVSFLLKKDDYKLKSRRSLEQMIVDKCSSKKLYYKDGKFNDQPFRDLRKNNPNTPEEEKRVKDKYDADMGNKK